MTSSCQAYERTIIFFGRDVGPVRRRACGKMKLAEQQEHLARHFRSAAGIDVADSW